MSPIYLVTLKTAVVEALRATFDVDYPEVDFRNILADIEFPVLQTKVPSLWVNYEDTEEVVIAGIDHHEVIDAGSGPQQVSRRRFGGVITITAVALSSLERDRMYDELVRMLAFARDEMPALSDFRNIIEQNDLVAMNINFDTLRPSGDNAAPGTPWGTDEVIYEKSISVDVIGEFVSDPGTQQLVLLSKIRTLGYSTGTPEPPFTGAPSNDVLDPGLPGSTPQGFEVHNPKSWH